MYRLIPAVIAILLTATTGFTASRIAVIHSYHPEYAWEQAVTQGLNESLPDNATIEHIYLDTKRTPVPRHAARAQETWEHLAADSPDLVVLCDDNAAKYLGPRLKDGPIPTVCLGLNANPRNYGIYPAKNMALVLERPLLKRSLHAMCKLVNTGATRVLVLFDSDTTSGAVIREAFQGETRFAMGNVNVEVRQFASGSDWQNAVLNARTDGFDTVYVGLYHTLRDASGAHIPEEEILAWTNAHTPVPIFAFWDFAVGKGKTIGGHVLSGREQGLAAGRIAVKILSGTSPAAIPPCTPAAGTYIFSVSELNRFGIKLPEQIREQATLYP